MPLNPMMEPGGYAGQDTDMIIEQIVKMWPDPYIMGLMDR